MLIAEELYRCIYGAISTWEEGSKKKSQKEVVFDRSLGKLTFIWAEKVFSGQENNKSKDLQT